MELKEQYYGKANSLLNRMEGEEIDESVPEVEFADDDEDIDLTYNKYKEALEVYEEWMKTEDSMHRDFRNWLRERIGGKSTPVRTP